MNARRCARFVRSRTQLGLAACTLVLVALGAAARAQYFQDPGELTPEEARLTDAEREAWSEIEQNRYLHARELGEKLLARDKRSFMAHMVLGFAQHYAEDNLPRALYHLDRALALYEKRYTDHPGPELPWRFHAALLRELSEVHGDMEHHAEKLRYIARYNQLYDPDMIAERAWPLMKLGRYREAHLAADLGLSTERIGERIIALNALCAIEFEAGNDGQSYDACKLAIDDGEKHGMVSAVDLTNFAEASRSLFKLDEAERVSLEATTAAPSWYGNPWMDLAELYVRQGRFGEALSALRQVPEYRMKRPPHVRDADQNEMRRALASFLLVLGKPEQAFDMTGRAIAAPERRAHNSRDPAQDRTVLGLLDRRARRVAAELLLERAASEPFYKWPLAYARAAWLRLQGRESAALVQRLLADDARLVGSFRIGTASSAVMPPWLIGELCDVLGPGVVSAALERTRKRDVRPGAAAYYDAVAAEVAWRAGDSARAEALALRAERSLGPSEVLLQARVLAIAAEAERTLGKPASARGHYDEVFQRDPGVLRRLELEVPVELHVSGGAVAEEAAGMLARSPRFAEEAGGLKLSVRASGASGRVCLGGDSGQVISCAEIEARGLRPGQSAAAHIAEEALRQLFSPRLDLSQTDINSLDGQNLSGREALKSIFD